MDDPLDEIRVTASRVERFSEAVEELPSEQHRALWRAALHDLRAAIRTARARGHDSVAIQQATGAANTGRFVRAPEAAVAAEDPAPQALATD